MRVAVACIQLNSGDNMQENIDFSAEMVCKSHAMGAELVALPENAFLMLPPGAKAQEIYTESAHPGVRAACHWAKTLRVWILVGSVTVKAEQPEEARSLNRSLLINPEGIISARYDKIHLFDVELPGGEKYAESARCAPGEQAVLASTPWGGLGMSVCYDVRFPQLYRQLAQAGASLLAVPAAFTRITGEAHWHVLLRARAIENGCFVLAPAQCGTHPGGRQTYGHALIIDPWGRVLAEAGEEPGIITATLDLAQVAEVRSRIPSLRHDRAFTLVQ